MMRGSLFGLALLISSSAWANPVVFSERADFDAAVPGLPTQGFEEPFETAAAVSFPGFSVREDSSFANVKSRTDYVSAGERSLGFTWNGNITLTFEFDSPIDAFAADILDFGTCCGATELIVADETGQWSVVAATGVDRPRGNLQFLGLVSDTPFSTLLFTSDQGSTNDLIVFDEVSFRTAATPEPAGVFMLMSGAVCLLGVRRRRRLREKATS